MNLFGLGPELLWVPLPEGPLHVEVVVGAPPFKARFRTATMARKEGYELVRRLWGVGGGSVARTGMTSARAVDGPAADATAQHHLGDGGGEPAGALRDAGVQVAAGALGDGGAVPPRAGADGLAGLFGLFPEALAGRFAAVITALLEVLKGLFRLLDVFPEGVDEAFASPYDHALVLQRREGAGAEVAEGGVGVPAATAAVGSEHVPVGFDVADRVAGGERVPVLGQRVQGQAEVGEGAGVHVLLQEAGGVGAVAAGAHVVAAGAVGYRAGRGAGADGAGVEAFAAVAVGVDRAEVVGVAGGQRLGVGAWRVGAAVGVIAVGGLDPAGTVDELGDRGVHVGAVGVGVRLGGACGGLVGHRNAVAVGVVGVGLGARVGAAGLLLLGGQPAQALVGELGGAVGPGAGAVQRVIGVGGFVGKEGGGVLAQAGEPVEVFVAVVGDQVR